MSHKHLVDAVHKRGMVLLEELQLPVHALHADKVPAAVGASERPVAKVKRGKMLSALAEQVLVGFDHRIVTRRRPLPTHCAHHVHRKPARMQHGQCDLIRAGDKPARRHLEDGHAKVLLNHEVFDAVGGLSRVVYAQQAGEGARDDLGVSMLATHMQPLSNSSAESILVLHHSLVVNSDIAPFSKVDTGDTGASKSLRGGG